MHCVCVYFIEVTKIRRVFLTTGLYLVRFFVCLFLQDNDRDLKLLRNNKTTTYTKSWDAEHFFFNDWTRNYLTGKS